MLLTRRELIRQTAAIAASAFCPRMPPEGARSTSSAPAPVVAQDLPGDRSIRQYLAARAAELEREFLPGINSAADFEKIRLAFREDLFDMLGLKPTPERTPLKAIVTGRIERPGYAIEKLHFQSLPGLYVTANLYLPDPAGRANPANGRHPTILYQVGHYNQHRRDGNKAAPDCIQQGIWFATHGYVALTMDTIELSEIAGLHRGLLGERRWWWHSAGYTPAGVETWNAIRALDYLVSRPEVDATRIGATGISGGGIGTFWIAAADERVKAAAPVSGIGDLTFYAGEDGISRHCDCFFLYNRARWNWTTICSLICPRPLLFVNSDNDIYFPMSGNERVSARLERIYSLFGAGDQVDSVISVGSHAYRTDIRRAVYEFFNRHLKGDARRVVDTPEDLRHFQTEIRARVQRLTAFEKPAGKPNTRSFGEIARDGYRIEKLLIEGDTGMPIPALLFKPDRSVPRRRVILYVHENGKAAEANAGGEIEDLVRGGAVVLAIDLCGRGETREEAARVWDIFGHFESAMTAQLVGKTLVGLRAQDIVRAVDALAARGDVEIESLSAFGKGDAAVVALHAAALDDRIKSVTLEGMLVSYESVAEWKIHHRVFESVVPAALANYDLPDLAASLAPRRLQIINAANPRGQRIETRQVKREYEAAQKAFAVAGAPQSFIVAERKPGKRLRAFIP